MKYEITDIPSYHEKDLIQIMDYYKLIMEHGWLYKKDKLLLAYHFDTILSSLNAICELIDESHEM